jgi:hypothetical protein
VLEASALIESLGGSLSRLQTQEELKLEEQQGESFFTNAGDTWLLVATAPVSLWWKTL